MHPEQTEGAVAWWFLQGRQNSNIIWLFSVIKALLSPRMLHVFVWRNHGWRPFMPTVSVPPTYLTASSSVVVVQSESNTIIIRLLVLAAIWPWIKWKEKHSYKSVTFWKHWAVRVRLSASPGPTARPGERKAPNTGALTSNNNRHVKDRQ